jgi:hypothetical protein
MKIPANTAVVVSTSASISGLAAGTYKVGLCMVPESAHSFIFDYVNAWFIVTN